MVLFLLLQLLLMVMLVVMIMVGSITIWSADRQIRKFGVQPVKFDDLEFRQSDSMIWSADRQIQRLRVQTVKQHKDILVNVFPKSF